MEEDVLKNRKQRKSLPPRKLRNVRPLTEEENKIFAAYTHNRVTREQIAYAIDNISLASYTGNIIITGEEDMDTLTLAKSLIKEVQHNDSNFSGKIAKISGESLNRKGVTETFEKLSNGALVVLSAGRMSGETIADLERELNRENRGIIVLLEDTKAEIHALLKEYKKLKECFNVRIDVEAPDNASLVAYGKEYAREKEYGIDELGVLALHTCIAERQTSDHTVTAEEVQTIIDAAIKSANRKTLGHFFEVVTGKRYDEEDMIVLREKDFI